MIEKTVLDKGGSAAPHGERWELDSGASGAFRDTTSTFSSHKGTLSLSNAVFFPPKVAQASLRAQTGGRVPRLASVSLVVA